MNNILVRETSSEIRAIARGAMKSNWPMLPIGVFVFYLMTVSVPALLTQLMPFAVSEFYYDFLGKSIQVSYVGNLYDFVLSGAFSVGLCSFLLAFFRKKDINPMYVFNGFECFPKAFGLFIVQGFFIFLWGLLFIVPGIIAALRYSQAFMILADDPKKSIMQCMNESKILMNGNKGKFFCLSLSFIGWGILAALPATYLPLPGGILGIAFDLIYSIPYFVLLAYIHVSRTVFYDLSGGRLVARPQNNAEEDHYYF